MRSGFAADAGAVAHLLVDELTDEINVSGEDGRHLARSRRLGPGERVTASDGMGRWRTYEVALADRIGLTIRASGALRAEPEPPVRIVLAFAPTKGGQPDRVVQHATELGVDRIHPLVTERTVVRWKGERERTARARLTRVAREAAAQSFRSRLPELGAPITPEDLAGRPGLVVATRGAGVPSQPPDGQEWVLAVGPEGGFSPAERELWDGASRLGVGDLVLRAETAVLASCAVLATLRGT